MLNSPAWPVRETATWALIAMPGGPPTELVLKLLDDKREEESWSLRLKIAEILVNNHNIELDRRAVQVAIDALDYATAPWYGLPHEGSSIRSLAVQTLSRLEPIYQDETIFNRLCRVLDEDQEANVRDAAYGALLRLAAAPEEKKLAVNDV